MSYTPQRFGWYQHKHGGLYQVLHLGKSTIDLSPVVVYNHEYPFDQAVFVRPASEWTLDRFEPITDAEAEFIMLTHDRDEMKTMIGERSTAARSQATATLQQCEWCHGKNFRTVTDNTNHTYDCKCVK